MLGAGFVLFVLPVLIVALSVVLFFTAREETE
jgi:hypothetical protein